MKCRPAKWILWAPLAALPFLAAWWLNTGSLENKLASSAAANLESAGAGWAKVAIDGRDATLAGDAPGRKPIDDAVKVVAHTYGIRRVDASAVKIKLAEPTIDSIVTNNNRPEVRGTWPEGNAKTLALTLPERRYVLGTDKELTSDGKGNWVWFPAEPLKDGAYNIGIEVSDGEGAIIKVEKPDAVTVDTIAPPAATFEPVVREVSPQSISGAWPEGDASNLTVGLAGKTHVLGSDSALTSASGRWTLAVAEPLAIGAYDLVIDVADKAGNLTRTTIAKAIVIAKAISKAAFTVDKYLGNDSTPTLSGTFDEAGTTSLAVAVGGKTYALGTAANLKSDGQGHWTVDIADPLKDGIYDVVVTASDALGNIVKDGTVAEIEIDATGPQAPTVNPANAFPLTGTFSVKDTKLLRATLAGRTYTLGTDTAMTTQENIWSLVPPVKLGPGTYDVVVEAVDSFGNASADQTRDELVIKPVIGELELLPPTIDRLEAVAARPTVTGSWQQDVATGLSVWLPGRTFVLGTNPELTSAGHRWSLAIPMPLKDGVYDVIAEVTGKTGKTKRDETKDELTVDAAGPASPTVMFYSGSGSPKAVRGTWAEGDAVSLAVTFNGKTARIGHDAALSTDRQGNWALVVTQPLQPGSYDVAVATMDKRGRVASDQTRNEILVKEGEVQPSPLIPPTIDKLESVVDRPALTGTWQQDIAAGLHVAVAGNRYVFGTNAELTSLGGRWSLAFPSALKDGVYDVVAQVIGKDGETKQDETKDELIVDAAGPAEPTIIPYAGEDSPETIGGSWAEGDAVTLTVALNGKTAALGRDASLTSNGKGRWSLALAEVLPPGSHDVAVLTADKHGRVASDSTNNEIIVEGKDPELVAPTVDSLNSLMARPRLTGTWQQDIAATLSVSIADKTYAFGTDAALTSTNGRWSLAIPSPLKDGVYDVVAEVTGKKGTKKQDGTKDELIVDATGPAAPTVASYSGEDSPASIGGTWAEGDAVKLWVTFNGKTTELGKDVALTSDGQGNWSLAVADKLASGDYDIAVTTADKHGRVASDQTQNEIVIKEKDDPTELTAPTIDQIESLDAQPKLTGGWQQDLAAGLSVTLAGRSFVFGTDAELTSESGRWTLALSSPLKDGIYDVVAEVTGKDGARKQDKTKDELIVDAIGPVAPTVAAYSGEDSPKSVGGTWGDAVTLSVTLSEKTATLGKDASVTADGKGNWLFGLTEILPPGTYDVAVTTADKHGRTASDATQNEIVVKQKGESSELLAPTIDRIVSLVARPTLTGTWQPDGATGLSIALASKSFVLGTDAELSSEGGHWSLAVPAPLKDGVYDVAAEVTSKDGAKKQDETKDELVVDAAGPAAPTVALYSGFDSPGSIGGSWAEGDAVSLLVSLNNKTAEFGKDTSLTSDGQGHWSLAVTDKLAPGSYDVAVVSADRRGRVASDQTRFEILVKQKEEPQIDCDTEFKKVLITRPVHFETDESAVTTEAAAVIKDLATIAGKCEGKRLEVGGHTDWVGSEAYNQALSERRAVAVVNALISQGVARARLDAKGYGESMPLASNETPEGCFVNRRIEIKTIK